MPVPITALYAGLLGLLLVFLGLRVTAERGRLRDSLGIESAPSLLEAVRVHGNAAEWVPLILLLMTIQELNGLPAPYLHAAGLVTLAARVLHPLGMKHDRIPHPLRFAGALLTYTVAGVLSLGALWQAVARL